MLKSIRIVADLKVKAQQIAQRAKGGESFAALALSFSQAMDKGANGGFEAEQSIHQRGGGGSLHWQPVVSLLAHPPTDGPANGVAYSRHCDGGPEEIWIEFDQSDDRKLTAQGQ